MPKEMSSASAAMAVCCWFLAGVTVIMVVMHPESEPLAWLMISALIGAGIVFALSYYDRFRFWPAVRVLLRLNEPRPDEERGPVRTLLACMTGWDG